MPTPGMILAAARELLPGPPPPRVPEPDLVMDDPAKVAAFHEAGAEGGVMTPVYLFHAAQVCDVVRPGDRVLDLGCGPANQLALVAALNPQTHFLGVDLSAEMLARAEARIAERGLANVALRRGDITELRGLEDGSVDAVISTVVLHHLPDEAALARCFAEIARVLRPGGGIYLVDFGRMRSEASMRAFAWQHARRQPELFTLDYFHSLRAAFRVEDFGAALARHLAGRARLYRTALVPYMVAVKSPPRRPPDEAARARLRALAQAMPPHQRRDLRDLRLFFRLGGLASRHL
ncbi:class I SAM-dependent methyltransferase [Inmirania thermothiophila]|uniref:Methyltransferase family protein n=1 Tax=Inmirania thermothiophila TaxID=1750597 RepID=A0A3N1Y890_9GAMM|nr:class I SAM-dependent methyltransferase [Inmirania thermothiophila]ROR34718.1 methyltransferase family protein [Inmirania thermothiophila]